MSTFQDRLKQVRGKLDQGEMSARFGIHLTSYGRYERGERSPDLEFIDKVCRTFNVSPTWLILGEGPMSLNEVREPAPVAPASPLDHELLRHVIEGVEDGLSRRRLTLPPDKKARLIDLLYEHFHKIKELPQAQMVDRFLKLVA